MLLEKEFHIPTDPQLQAKMNALRNTINLVDAFEGTSLELDLHIKDEHYSAEVIENILISQGFKVSTLSQSRLHNEKVILVEWSDLVGKEKLQDYVSRREEQAIQRSLPVGNDWGRTSKNS